jgi:hypothetical protein
MSVDFMLFILCGLIGFCLGYACALWIENRRLAVEFAKLDAMQNETWAILQKAMKKSEELEAARRDVLLKRWDLADKEIVRQ